MTTEGEKGKSGAKDTRPRDDAGRPMLRFNSMDEASEETSRKRGSTAKKPLEFDSMDRSRPKHKPTPESLRANALEETTQEERAYAKQIVNDFGNEEIVEDLTGPEGRGNSSEIIKAINAYRTRFEDMRELQSQHDEITFNGMMLGLLRQALAKGETKHIKRYGPIQGRFRTDRQIKEKLQRREEARKVKEALANS